jgi:hypothetical protein
MEEQLSDYKSLIREFGKNLEMQLSGENWRFFALLLMTAF